MIEKIRELIGSNGEKGWPVAARDRIAYPPPFENLVTTANVGVAFLWTMRDVIVPNLEKDNLAIAANFYTPSGIAPMIRNILGNPHIRYVIMLGNESSSKAKGDKSKEQTSANALREFFTNGLNAKRKLAGLESSLYIDKNIPTESIRAVEKNVQLIDLNANMPGSTLEAQIAEANRLTRTLPRLEPFAEPQVFDYEPPPGAFPYEGGPIVVHGDTIPQAWIKMISAIRRYGRLNFMNAGTDRRVQEVNNMVVTIHDPQNMDLSLNPFLVPLSEEKIEAYKAEILSPILPAGKAYTYGNKLRAYRYPAPQEIRNLVTSTGFADFEFKKGLWLDSHVSYVDDHCEINQVAEIIEVLKRDRYSKACVAITWHPADELMRKHKSSPCLVSIQALVQDEKLNLTAYFRSHDMTQGWPDNAYGCAAIQAEIASVVGVPTGLLTIISDSAQIYQNYYAQVDEMLAKYGESVPECSDSRGNFRIQVKGKSIVVTLMDPETGIEMEKYVGKTAYELRDKIAAKNSLMTNHAIYLGTELVIAEMCLRSGKPYEQDATLDTSQLF